MATEASSPKATGIASIVAPVVHDLARPLASEVGIAAQKVAHAILLPMYKAIEGWEATVERVAESVAKRLKDVADSDITDPAKYVAGPVLDGIRFATDEEVLFELFATLLATSMHAPNASRAHPSFAGIIRQLSPDEARIVHCFATSGRQQLVDIYISGGRPIHSAETETRTLLASNQTLLATRVELTREVSLKAYLGNLIRLGLLEIPPDTVDCDAIGYDLLQSLPEVQAVAKDAEEHGFDVYFERKVIRLTPFGEEFASACVFGPAYGTTQSQAVEV